MSVLSKQQLPIAVPKKTKMKLDSQHVTTSDFMSLQPVYYRHMIPGEHIKIDASCISRLAPLAVPTYGRCNLNLRAFFVPYRVVNPTFSDFIADTIFSSGTTSNIPSQVPLLFNSELIDLVKLSVMSYDLGTTLTPGQVYDYYDGTSQHYYYLTEFGRGVVKMLESLGYRIAMGPDKIDLCYNALGLLAYAKIYLDWYSLSQYQNSSTYLYIAKLLAYNNPSSPLILTATDLLGICNLCTYVSYDQDYFTSQWDNPVAASSGNFSTLTGPDVTNPTGLNSIVDVGNYVTNGTPVLMGGNPIANTPYRISEYSLHLLHAINNYVKRHQMSGARNIDRLLVAYGIQLRAEKLNRSSYLGNAVIPIQIGDVMQTADTSTPLGSDVSNLGDYAGCGYLKGQNHFEYESEEFGMFCICASIMPGIDYVQGFDRNNIHLQKTDFFNGEFDNCGVQAAAKGEMYVSRNGSFVGDNVDYLGVMGFLPRYAEYKVGRSFLTGDFAFDSANVGRTSWNMFRLFDDSSFGGSISGVVHGIGLCGSKDRRTYDRIFQQPYRMIDPTNSGTEEPDYFDHFNLFYNFEVESYVPALPLYDTYRFEEEENRPTVTMEPNGSRLN